MSEPGASRGVYRWSFGNVEFDESRWELVVAGAAVELERKPLDVLAYLLRHAGEIVTKDELLESVWAGRVVVEAALTNAVGKLRRALGESGGSAVATIARVGYRLSVPVSRRSVPALPPHSQLVAGQPVPRRPNWRLADRLARSGDGEVWRAVHAKTGDVRVFKFSLDGHRLGALKREVTLSRVLRGSLGDRDDFVRIIDWDFEEAPFFVEAEYGGLALDVWAVEEDRLAALPLAGRLALMLDVANAVAAAHDAGVLHKDLKPSNLLVSQRDGRPRARVADFGSGRLLDTDQIERLGITQLGQTQRQSLSSDSGDGTPLYLAPEVVAGQAPSIKSDLYALGVILYQLVTGDLRRQLSPGWEADVADPLLREDITDFANGDPARRPASAHDLVARLTQLEERRIRRDTELAVRQRIADTERRLSRARARRPWVAAAVVLLLLGLGSTTWLYQQARAAQSAALQERNAALAMNRFLRADILGLADPFQAGRPDITMREALDRGGPRIDRRFALQPAIAAPMHETMATAYGQLSDYTKSAAHFEAAALAYRRSGGRTDREVVEAVLAAEARARGAQAGQVPSDAEFEALAKRVAALPPAQRPLPRIYLDRAQAWAAFQRLEFARAVPPLEDALGQLALLPDADPDLEATIRQAHAMALAHTGVPTTRVLELQREAMRRHAASASTAKVPMALSARYAAARMRMIAGDERLLEDEYRQIIAELVQTIGPRTETTLVAQHGLAHIYFKQGRWEDCRALEQRNIAAMQEVLGPAHLSTINSINSLAVCMLAAGDAAGAGAELERALAKVEPGDGIKEQLVRMMLKLNLAHARASQERWGEVTALLSEIRKDGGRLVQLDSDAEGEVLLLEGQALASKGAVDQARRSLVAGIAALRKKNPADYWLVLRGQQVLAHLSSSAKARAPRNQ